LGDEVEVWFSGELWRFLSFLFSFVFSFVRAILILISVSISLGNRNSFFYNYL